MIVGNGISGFRMGGGGSENLHVPTADVGKAGHHVKGVGGEDMYLLAGAGEEVYKGGRGKN